MFPRRITIFVTIALGFGSLNPLRDPWLRMLGWGASHVNCSKDFCWNHAGQRKWPGSKVGWLASLVPHSNHGTQGFITSRQDEALRDKFKDMSKMFLCKYSQSQSKPPTYIYTFSGQRMASGGSHGCINCTLWVSFKREGGPKWDPRKGRPQRHTPAHMPLSSLLPSPPQDFGLGGSYWQLQHISEYPSKDGCATDTRNRRSGEIGLNATLAHLTVRLDTSVCSTVKWR